MKTCDNMNIIVQTTDEDASSFNGRSESPNKKVSDITRDIIFNLSYRKELCCFVYHYGIWPSCQTDNILYGDVTYFLLHGTIPSYKHITIWGWRFYIINVNVTRNKPDNRSH